MTRNITGLCICLLTAVSVPASEPARLTIPKATTKPTLDGRMAAGEWEDAAAATGLLSQFGRVAHPRQVTFWLKYDAAHLYVACRSTVFPEELNPVSPQTWFDRDSSIVVGIAPARKGRGTSPSHFLLRANIAKQLQGREIFWTMEGGGHPDVKLTFPHPGWTSGATVEQTIENGVWVCEMRLPLANLKAADAKDGEQWGLLLGRDYSAADQSALTLSSDWRFGDGNRHYGRAFYNNYRFEKEYGRMTLGGAAPAAQLIDLGDFVSGKPAPVVALKNLTDAALKAVVRVEYLLAVAEVVRIRTETPEDRSLTTSAMGSGKLGQPQEQTLDLAPGERKSHTFAAVALPAGETAICAVTVTGPSGVLLTQQIPLQPGWGTDRSSSTPELYFSGGHFGGQQANNILLPTGYDPIVNRFYGRLRIGALPETHLAARTEIAICRAGERKPVATLTPKAVTAPEVQLAFDDRSYGAKPAAVLEWLCPEDGVTRIDMEGGHWYAPGAPSDGEAMQVLHVSAGKSTVLIPRQVFAESQKWKPIAAKDVAVKKGDKIQFYWDRNGTEGCDDFRLRGTLTHVGMATHVYAPAGELSDRPGGLSGVWFYRYDTDATPNPDGVYPELTWGTQTNWFNQVGWMKFWDKEPARHQAMIRRIVAAGDEMIVEDELPELQPGVYQATASVYTQDSRLLGGARQMFTRYDHRKDLPWLFERVGASTKVLPPWEPIQGVRCPLSVVGGGQAEGYRVRCWGREYRVDGSGLFAGIRSVAEVVRLPDSKPAAPNSHEFGYAGPVRIEMRRESKTIALAPDAAPGEVKVADHEASWKGVLTGDGWRVETAVAIEYDGYAQHRVRIVPLPDKSEIQNPKSEIDSLRLVIPLLPEVATHLHAVGGEWFRATVSSIALGETQGVLWHSGQNCGGGTQPYNEDFGKKYMTVGSFRPYVWVGNAQHGLAFMADNDQGWVPDDSRKVPAIEVVRAGTEVQLVLNLVARPFAFDKPREIVFSLQATPIRPLPDDIRARRQHLTMGSAFPGGRGGDTGWAWTGQMYQMKDDADPSQSYWFFGLPGSCPYPLSWDISKWYQGESDKTFRGEGSFHGGDKWIYTPYQGQHSVMTFPEVDDPRMPPGKQVSDVYGYIYPHMSHGHLEHGNPNLAQVDVGYRLWCYRNWIKHAGLRGMYFDLSEPVLSANPNAGFGYALDLPDRPALDGKVQPGYGVTRVREFYKRLRTLFVENGVEEPYIWVHSTDGNIVSAFAFIGFLLEGENEPRVSPKLPVSQKIPPARMQAMRSSAGGLGFTQLEMIGESSPLVLRDVTGWWMLHDTGQGGCGIGSAYNWAGIDLNRRADFLPYWSPRVAAALKTAQPETYASAWRQDNALRVLVYNRNNDPVAAQVQIDLAALGLAVAADKPLAATELERDAKPEVRGGGEVKAEATGNTLTVTVPVLNRNFRLFRVGQ